MEVNNPMDIIKNDLRVHHKYGYLRGKLEKLPVEVSRNELIELGIKPCDVDKVADAFLIDLID